MRTDFLSNGNVAAPIDIPAIGLHIQAHAMSKSPHANCSVSSRGLPGYVWWWVSAHSRGLGGNWFHHWRSSWRRFAMQPRLSTDGPSKDSRPLRLLPGRSWSA
jgi:hypothetical protein